MKVAVRLSSFLILGMVAILAIETAMAVLQERKFIRDDMGHDARLLGRAMSGLVVDVWLAKGQQRAFDLISEVNRHEKIVQVRWVWTDGREARFHEPRVDLRLLDRVTRGAMESLQIYDREKGAQFVTYVPVRVPGERPAALELSESLRPLEERNRATLLRVSSMLCGLLAIGTGGVVVLGTVLIGRPLRRLSQAVQRIGKGELDTRLENVRHDEFGEFADALNAMCRELVKARQEARVEMERRIATLEQLRHADRLTTVGKLAAGVAHEVGTPLNVILARAKQLAAGAPSSLDSQKHAGTIVAQTERIAATIRQVLTFARQGKGLRERLDVAEVVARSVGLLQAIAKKRGVTLSTIPAETHVIVAADARQIEQVADNLIMNAIQAVPPGGRVELRVFRSSACRLDDGDRSEVTYACFSVSDDGEGIPLQNLERVFDPYFTTKDVGEGTGLGLSLAQEIAREHGGWIDVTSQLGRGTTFTVYLHAERDLGSVSHDAIDAVV